MMEAIRTESNSVTLMPAAFYTIAQTKQMRQAGVHASLVLDASVRECAKKCQLLAALDRTEELRRIRVRYGLLADS